MTAARKACRRRRVLVDGATSGCGAQVCVGQLLQVLEPVEQPGSFSTDPQQRGQRRPRATPPPPGIHIPILFDDDYITAVVKPWGIKCHGYGSHHLAAYVRALVPPSNQAEALPGGAHPAHRLDQLTGGVMLFVKTRPAAAALARQFEARHVRKQYRALVAGRLDGPPGGGPIIIDHPVEGRPAHTEVRVASHSRCLRYGGWITTVDLVPRTGRRHQLRRHLAICLGHPILGDPLYTRWAGGAAGEAAAEAALMAAPPDELRARMQAADGGGGGGEGNEVELLKGWGMALWAGAIELEHPVTGEDMSWSLPEPARFEKLRAQQAARWEKFYGVGAVDGAPSSPERVSPSL